MTELQSAPVQEIPASQPKLNVFKTDPHTDPRWQAFLLAHPEGTIYHHSKWIRVIEAEYGQENEHLACANENGEFLAIMPMLYTRGLPFNRGGSTTGRRLSSLLEHRLRGRSQATGMRRWRFFGRLSRRAVRNAARSFRSRKLARRSTG